MNEKLFFSYVNWMIVVITAVFVIFTILRELNSLL